MKYCQGTFSWPFSKLKFFSQIVTIGRYRIEESVSIAEISAGKDNICHLMALSVKNMNYSLTNIISHIMFRKSNLYSEFNQGGIHVETIYGVSKNQLD